MTGVSIRGEETGTERQHREGNMKTEAETGATQLQAKERQGLPATATAGTAAENSSLSEGTDPDDTLLLDFWPPGL